MTHITIIGGIRLGCIIWALIDTHYSRVQIAILYLVSVQPHLECNTWSMVDPH